MNPKDEANLLGVRFRDLVQHAFILGKRAAEAKHGSSVLYQGEYEAAVKLWEEVMEFMRRQVEAANPKKPEPNGVKK